MVGGRARTRQGKLSQGTGLQWRRQGAAGLVQGASRSGGRARQRELGVGGGCWDENECPSPLSHFIRPRWVAEEAKGHFRCSSQILRNLDSPAK